jgi:membrane-associated protein
MKFLDPTFLITTLGLVGVGLIIFAESGLLIGLLFPGDSLLFVAGIFAGEGYFSVVLLLIIAIAAAILGDSFGYWFGWKFGPKVFKKEESFLFKKSYVTKTEAFYAKHGKKTVAIARFVPIVRTFAPIMAGVGGMPYASFVMWNIVGGIAWASVFVLGGYFLNALFPDSEKFLTYATFGIIVVSLAPAGYQVVRSYFKKS